MKKINLLKQRIISIVICTAILFTILIPGSIVFAATNPYSISNEPTRAVWYTIPTMRGNDVKWIQAALNAFGNYGLELDGSFGPACKSATLKFQSAMGLEQDGSFGPATRRTMVNWLKNNGYSSGIQPSSTSSISPNGKAFYKQSSGGCYTASCAMIMTNLGATWNGNSATYWNVFAANGGTAYLSWATPGKFGCRRSELSISKSSVVDAVKKYPQGVMVAFYQPNKGWNHCMVAVGLDSSGEPLFFDPARNNGSNNGNGYTLSQTSAGSSYGKATWGNVCQVSIITR